MFVESQSFVDGPGIFFAGRSFCPQASHTCCDSFFLALLFFGFSGFLVFFGILFFFGYFEFLSFFFVFFGLTGFFSGVFFRKTRFESKKLFLA